MVREVGSRGTRPYGILVDLPFRFYDYLQFTRQALLEAGYLLGDAGTSSMSNLHTMQIAATEPTSDGLSCAEFLQNEYLAK